MIVCNGIVGLCLLWGGARHHEQGFHLHGASAALAVLAALTTLTLILPNVATTAPGPLFSTSQLVFAGVVSLVLYGSFVFVQTMRHRDYFLPPTAIRTKRMPRPRPTRPPSSAWPLLLAALVAIVGLAKALTPAVESAIDRATCRRPWSASLLRRWCCSLSALRRCGPRAATGCRPA